MTQPPPLQVVLHTASFAQWTLQLPPEQVKFAVAPGFPSKSQCPFTHVPSLPLSAVVTVHAASIPKPRPKTTTIVFFISSLR